MERKPSVASDLLSVRDEHLGFTPSAPQCAASGALRARRSYEA